MRTKTALNAASNWHGGKYSQLYSFASTGNFNPEFSLWICEEIIQEIIRPEIALKPFIRSKKDQKELNDLLNYFLSEFKKLGVDIRIGRDFYQLPIPVLYGSNLNVRSIKRLI